MGRCNNRRAQQNAQEMRNTPSRARFSNNASHKRKGKRSAGSGGRDGKGDEGGRGGDNTNNKNTSSGSAKAAVVQKITKRVEHKQQLSSTASTVSSSTPSSAIFRTRRHPLANVEIQKLDELVIPEDSLQDVTKLLANLNVKVVESAEKEFGKSDYRDVEEQCGETEVEVGNDDDERGQLSDVDEGTQPSSTRPKYPVVSVRGYSEYEDDGEDEDDLLESEKAKGPRHRENTPESHFSASFRTEFARNHNPDSNGKKVAGKATDRWAILRSALLGVSSDRQKAAGSIHQFGGFDFLKRKRICRMRIPALKDQLLLISLEEGDDETSLVEALAVSLLALAALRPDNWVWDFSVSCLRANLLWLDKQEELLAALNQRLQSNGSKNAHYLKLAKGSGWMSETLNVNIDGNCRILRVILAPFFPSHGIFQYTLPIFDAKGERLKEGRHNNQMYLFTRERLLSASTTLEELISHHRHNGVDNTGNICVWDSEQTLAYILLKSLAMEEFTSWPESGDKEVFSILELGSGMAGLSGLSLALMLQLQNKPFDVRLWLTDGHPQAVHNNRVNARLIQAQLQSILPSYKLHSIQSLVLPWSLDPPTIPLPQCQMVLVSDCTHFQEFHAHLFFTLAYSVCKGGTIYLCQPHRGDSLERFLDLVRLTMNEPSLPLFSMEQLDIMELNKAKEGALGGHFDPDVHFPHCIVLKKIRDVQNIDQLLVREQMRRRDEFKEEEEKMERVASTDEIRESHSLRSDPVFIHLTQRLSFSSETASRACRAVEDIAAAEHSQVDQEQDYMGNSDNSNDKMASALDWLCLHMKESELQQGFKPNPNMTSSVILMGTGRTKPIPHPSISLAPTITKDRDWKKRILLNEKIFGFLPLGFHHAEALEIFYRYSIEHLEHGSLKKAIDDNEALRLLLSGLERRVLNKHSSNSNGESMGKNQQPYTTADLDDAAEDRISEEQALSAIYDEQFQVIADHSPENTHYQFRFRYKIAIDLSEPLREPARSEECVLHVFTRPGYPLFETPLLLFHNPGLPPSLLRRINVKLIQTAQHSLGSPVVFELVNYLSSKLPSMQTDFIEGQHMKEVEGAQLRSQSKADYNFNDYENCNPEAKLGRRQRAKAKAAAKAWDNSERNDFEDGQRGQTRSARLERIRHEDNNIRQTMAFRAMKQREDERHKEEAERDYRSALSAALNSGADLEHARATANKAKLAYLNLHGLEVPNGLGVSVVCSNISAETEDFVNGKRKDDQSNGMEIKKVVANEYSTSTAVSFIERLREMYTAAANAKAQRESTTTVDVVDIMRNAEDGIDGYHLIRSKNATEEENMEMKKQRFPRPVAVPVGELKSVMQDVINTQRNQPWLVAPEARAPGTSLAGECDNNLEKFNKERQDLNRKLRDEHERKFKALEDWKKDEGSTRDRTTQNNRAHKGFTPQRLYTLLSQREKLPAYAMGDHIISTIDCNQVTVVAGDTGCGKTTQVPQLVLDEFIKNNRGAEANIIVTQPRRISAIGVAERIADERCERVGETCGYSIMLEKKASRKTRLLLCTTGILLRRLQIDPDVASVSHIFVDEVHERDLNTDFLLIILRELLKRRRSLKLVLMSATLNAEAFSDYFGGCAIVSIPGRAHPVKEYRLEDILQITEYEVKEDSDYALKSTEHKLLSKSALRRMYYPRYNSKVIHSLSIANEKVVNYELMAVLLEKLSTSKEDGAILVFVPGMVEITKAIDEMRKHEFFQSPAVVIYPLHSSLSTAEQTAVFDIPPEGVRKVVVGTNIAETSITIEDVVFVVDCGRVKESRKDEMNETPTLVESWVSRASAKQRRGRAGRVRPGICYHMFSSHTYEREMDEYQLPEMLRVGLEDLVLQILILDLGEPSSFLGKALDPPSELSMRNSLKLLEELGAVDCDWKNDDDGDDDGGNSAVKLEEPKICSYEDNGIDSLANRCGGMKVHTELTALGFHLATLPVDPRVGKMMIYGALFGCIDPALTIAASMTARSPFISPFDKRDEADAARQKFSDNGCSSDHLATLNAFTTWKRKRRRESERAAQNFVRKNYLSRQTLFHMEDLRKQFCNLLISIGFLPGSFRLEKVGMMKGGDGKDDDDAIRSANVNSENTALVKAVLCAGLYPNIIVSPRSLVSGSASDGKEAGEVSFSSLNKGDVFLHPSTIAFHKKRLDSRYCCYHEMVRTSKTYVRDCTTVSPFALVLFGGTLVVYQDKGVVTVDEWLKFRIGRRAATLVKHLRTQMESMLLRKIVSPEDDVTRSDAGQALIQSISTLLQRAGDSSNNSNNSGGSSYYGGDDDVNLDSRRNDGAEIVRPWS